MWRHTRNYEGAFSFCLRFLNPLVAKSSAGCSDSQSRPNWIWFLLLPFNTPLYSVQLWTASTFLSLYSSTKRYKHVTGLNTIYIYIYIWILICKKINRGRWSLLFCGKWWQKLFCKRKYGAYRFHFWIILKRNMYESTIWSLKVLCKIHMRVMVIEILVYSIKCGR